MKKVQRFAVGLIVAGSLLVGVSYATAGGKPGSTRDNPPPLPAFIDPDTGVVDISKVPQWVPVGNPEGPDRWARSADLFGPPGAPIHVYDKPNGKVVGMLSNGADK